MVSLDLPVGLVAASSPRSAERPVADTCQPQRSFLHPSRNWKVAERCPASLHHRGRDGVAVAVSFVVAAPLLPGRRIWDGAGPAGATRQAGDQGVCGVEVRGFEPLASSVRERTRGARTTCDYDRKGWLSCAVGRPQVSAVVRDPRWNVARMWPHSHDLGKHGLGCSVGGGTATSTVRSSSSTWPS
jgi:hypothetical protein